MISERALTRTDCHDAGHQPPLSVLSIVLKFDTLLRKSEARLGASFEVPFGLVVPVMSMAVIRSLLTAGMDESPF